MKRERMELARAKLPAIARDAANGTPTTLIRRGKPIAEVVPVGTWERLTGGPRYGVTADEHGNITSRTLLPDGPVMLEVRPCEWLREAVEMFPAWVPPEGVVVLDEPPVEVTEGPKPTKEDA